ncbi:unnamed protein product [Musa textilis]
MDQDLTNGGPPPAAGSPHLFADNVNGFLLAAASSAFIGAGFIVKKQGLRRPGASGFRAGVGGYGSLLKPLWWIGMVTSATMFKARNLYYGHNISSFSLSSASLHAWRIGLGRVQVILHQRFVGLLQKSLGLQCCILPERQIHLLQIYMHRSLPRYFGTSRGMVIWESSRTMICPPGELVAVLR